MFRGVHQSLEEAHLACRHATSGPSVRSIEMQCEGKRRGLVQQVGELHTTGRAEESTRITA